MRSLTHKYKQSFKLKVGYREREIERERRSETHNIVINNHCNDLFLKLHIDWQCKVTQQKYIVIAK